MPPLPAYLRPALAGAAATCSGNGLGRFAYVPLFPAMVTAGWVDGGEAGLVGAAALLGYLIGILTAQGVGRALGVPRTLDLGMAVLLVTLLACAWPVGFWWLMGWRTLAGIAGGFLVALAGPAAQASVVPERRGAAAGLVMGGVGGGIALGAVLVPAALPFGVTATWLGLAALVALLWAWARPRWPDMPMRRAAARGDAPPAAEERPTPAARGTGLLILTYGLHGAGMVPPMVYLADLAARGRGLGVGVGAAIWLVFGLSGVVGSVLSGRTADRLGGAPTLTLWLVIQALSLAVALPPAAWLVLPTAALAGFAAVGTAGVTLSVTRQMVPASPAQAATLWVRSTAAFAVAQTAMGFALAALFAATGESHAAVFGAGLLLSVGAVAAAAMLARRLRGFGSR
jgi:predicted MFS family arabinose efflux permease